MASEKQRAANILNSLKSTGPKNTQNVRFNALRHGLRAKTLVLPDENQAEFDALLQDLETEFQPQTPAEFIQVERMAVNYWKLARADRREAFFRLNEMPDRFVDQSFKFQQGYERAFDRAQRSLERLQANRGFAELSPEPPTEAVETIQAVEAAAEIAEVATKETAELPAETTDAVETMETAQTAPEPQAAKPIAALGPSIPPPRRLLVPPLAAPALCPSLPLCLTVPSTM